MDAKLSHNQNRMFQRSGRLHTPKILIVPPTNIEINVIEQKLFQCISVLESQDNQYQNEIETPLLNNIMWTRRQIETV